MRLFVPASVAAAIVAADSASDLCLERPDLPKCGTSCYNPARAACCGSQVYLYYQWDPATNATAEQQCCTDRHNASYVAFSCNGTALGNGTASGNRTVGNATRGDTIVAPTKLPVVEDEYSASGSDFDDDLDLRDSDIDDDGEDDGEDEFASLGSDIDELGEDDVDDEGEDPIFAGVNAHIHDDEEHGSKSTTPTMHPTTQARSTPHPTTSDDTESDEGVDETETTDEEHDADATEEVDSDTDAEDVGAEETDAEADSDADAVGAKDADADADAADADAVGAKDADDTDAEGEVDSVGAEDADPAEDAEDVDADFEAVDVDDAETDGSGEETDAPLSPKPTVHSAGNHTTGDQPQLLNTSAEHEKPLHVPGAALTQTNSTHNNSTHNATHTNRTGSNLSDEATIQRPSSATSSIPHCAGLLAVLCIFGSMLV